MPSGVQIPTTAQMRAIESAAMSSGKVSGLQLMETAGRAVSDQVRLRWPRPGRVLILCGPGNNGGDGYVIAHRLHRAGWRVQVFGPDNMPGPDAAEMRQQWQAIASIAPLTQAAFERADGADLVVDAIFGTGLTRPPEGEIAAILAALAAPSVPPIVAVDCPSGLCMDSGTMLGHPRHGGRHAAAHLTVAFDSPKPGHLIGLGPHLCGQVVITDIGLRPWREQRTDLGLTSLWPDFPITDSRTGGPPWRELQKSSDLHPHKFSHGHALVLAGGPARGGAARLAARAALRIGAGLVTVAPPATAMADHAGRPHALMRHAVDDSAALEQVLADPWIAALCIGPGCGIDRAADLLVPALAAARPAVLDADALTALSRDADLMARLHAGCVLTPHGGEFARLFPDLAGRLDALPLRGPAYSRLDAARDAAARSGTVVLLKGPDTVIAAPDGRARIHSAFDVPWLATAGAGDVLAGLITGLLARGQTPLDSACLGALIHARAARLFGPGLIADDLPDMIPAVLREIELQKSQSSSWVATALPIT